MPNRYELLSRDLDSDEMSWSSWSSSNRSSSNHSSPAQNREPKNLRSVKELGDPEFKLLNRLDKRKWLTDDGKPIDYDVMKKYLKQVEESEGFNITDYPGVILGVTSVRPCQSLIDNREKSPGEYDVIMDLATSATKTYNNKHQTEFKVVEIEKVNVLYHCSSVGTYYITFSAIDVSARNYGKGSLQSSLYNQFVNTITAAQVIWVKLLIWLKEIIFVESLDDEIPFDETFKTDVQKLKERLLKLHSAPELRAGKDDLLDEACTRKIFQAVVVDGRKQREVLSCRVAK